jgi:L-rhamnose isomerase
MSEQMKKYYAGTYESICKMMWHKPENVEDLRQQFKSHTLTLDAIRNERFQDACPELAKWFESL